MKPKQFDHIENRIKEAAESTDFSFDESSWEKMNTLLDKQKKDRRRPFAWWWFVLPALFFGGYTFYLFVKNDSDKIATQQSLNTSNTIAEKKQASPSPVTIELANNNNQINYTNTTPLALATKKYLQKNITMNISRNIIVEKEDNTITEKNTSLTEPQPLEISSINKFSKEDKSEPPANLHQENLVVTDTIKSIKKDIAATDTSNKSSLKKNKNDKKIKKISGLYLLAAIGADAGSVKFLSLKNNTITARYGIGAGYQLNKKFSVQTGFYAGHKKYVAYSGDYTPKPGTYMSTVDIEKVNADCLIYEIPLAIRYNIFSSPKTAYYTTVGISSFIMKNEDYYYYYKRYNMSSEGGWNYTGNKNLFSVCTFSAGVEKKLSNIFFLQVEPSVSIPISGIGEGKVKLYSTAIQVGLKYQLPHN